MTDFLHFEGDTPLAEMVLSWCETPKHQGRGSFKGYVVTKISFEEVGAQINLEFDRRSGPRCPGCDSRLARNKCGRRAVMDCPMPNGPIVMLTFPTVQSLCRKCDRYVTTCPADVSCDLAADEACQRLGVACHQRSGGRHVQDFRRHGEAL